MFRYNRHHTITLRYHYHHTITLRYNHHHTITLRYNHHHTITPRYTFLSPLIQPSLALCDLYFLTTELLPLLQTRLIARMGDHGKDLANTFAQFRAALRSCVVILLQTLCDDALRAFQFSPQQYISSERRSKLP